MHGPPGAGFVLAHPGKNPALKPRSLDLSARLFISLLGVGLAPLMLLGVLAWVQFSDTLTRRTGGTLAAIASDAIDKIDRSLFERQADARVFAAHPGARGDAASIAAAADLFVVSYRVYDLLFVTDLEGRILGANTVSSDGTKLDTARLIGRTLPRDAWFEKAAGGMGDGGPVIAEAALDPLARELHGRGLLSIRVAAPIHDETGAVRRLWCSIVSFDRLAGPILEETESALARQGMPGRIDLISRSGLLLRDADPKAVLSVNLASLGVEAARRGMLGERGFTVEEHRRRHIPQVNGFAASRGAFDVPGLGWVLLARVDEADARAAATRLGRFVLAIVAAAAAAVAAVSILIARTVSRPVRRTVEVLEGVAAGELGHMSPSQSRGEIGRMVRAVNETVTVLKALHVGVSRQSASVRAGRLADRIDTAPFQGAFRAACEELNALVDAIAAPVAAASGTLETLAAADPCARVAADYPGDFGRLRNAVNAAAGRLQEAVAVFARVTEGLTGASRVVAEASREVATGVRTSSSQAGAISSAAVEVATSAHGAGDVAEYVAARAADVSRTSTELTKRVGSASSAAASTAATLTRLRASIEDIGRIVKSVSAIATQTNLLALNATIEAARAGESGRGFGIVANEVKDLARQTSTAADEIRRGIEAVNAESEKAMADIGEIEHVIRDLGELHGAMETAVADQVKSAGEIGSAVSDAAAGAARIAKNAGDVAGSAEATAGAAGRAEASARELAGLAGELEAMIARLRC